VRRLPAPVWALPATFGVGGLMCDEFARALVGTERAGAEDALRRLRVASPANWSVGLVEWRQGESLDRAMARADEELYRAKRGSRELRAAASLVA
jgi:GGDEF domain-containing protein